MKCQVQPRRNTWSTRQRVLNTHAHWTRHNNTIEKHTDRVHIQSAKRVLDGVAGLVFLSLGVAGALLPGLPATPFLLLASWFWARSFPRLNNALLRFPMIGRIISDWQYKRGVSRSTKAKAILLVCVSLAVTLYFSLLAIPARLLVATLGGIGTIVIMRIQEV